MTASDGLVDPKPSRGRRIAVGVVLVVFLAAFGVLALVPPLPPLPRAGFWRESSTGAISMRPGGPLLGGYVEEYFGGQIQTGVPDITLCQRGDAWDDLRPSGSSESGIYEPTGETVRVGGETWQRYVPKRF